MTQINYVRQESVEFQEVYGTGKGANKENAIGVAFMDSGLEEKPKGAEYFIQPDPVGGFIATLGMKK